MMRRSIRYDDYSDMNLVWHPVLISLLLYDYGQHFTTAVRYFTVQPDFSPAYTFAKASLRKIQLTRQHSPINNQRKAHRFSQQDYPATSHQKHKLGARIGTDPISHRSNTRAFHISVTRCGVLSIK